MLQQLRTFEHLTVQTACAKIGRVEDLLFDDGHWNIHYIVVNPGGLFGRLVLVSPLSFREPDWTSGRLLAHSTGRPRDGYWNDAATVLTSPSPIEISGVPASCVPAGSSLHALTRLHGMQVHLAEPGVVACIDDVLVDAPLWRVRYLMLETLRQPPGSTRIPVPVHRITSVDLSRSRLQMDVTRHEFEQGPIYDEETPLDANAEQRLLHHYGSPRTNASGHTRAAGGYCAS